VSAALSLGLFLLGLVLVVSGAELFFDGLLAAAARWRASPFALTVLVSGLELENLAAGIALNAKGLEGAAAGTFLGGTTFLALAASGLAALIAPIRTGLPRAVLAWTAAAPLPLLALGLDGRLTRLDGVLLIAWFCAAMVGLVRRGCSVLGGAPAKARRGPLLRLGGGLALLTLGGDVLGEGLRRVVSHLDVSGTLLGNTVVAAGVEGEEVARSVVPSRRGRGDLALANIAGTIVHFAALNAGVIALVRPLSLNSDSLHLHLPVAVGATALLSALIGLRSGLGRGEGALLVTLYCAYVALAIAIA
jgi:cation:H+ antiporter